MRPAQAARVRLLGRSPGLERNDAAGVFLGPHPGCGRRAAQADKLPDLAQVVEQVAFEDGLMVRDTVTQLAHDFEVLVDLIPNIGNVLGRVVVGQYRRQVWLPQPFVEPLREHGLPEDEFQLRYDLARRVEAGAGCLQVATRAVAGLRHGKAAQEAGRPGPAGTVDELQCIGDGIADGHLAHMQRQQEC